MKIKKSLYLLAGLVICLLFSACNHKLAYKDGQFVIENTTNEENVGVEDNLAKQERCQHEFTVTTCTEDSVCIKCGLVNEAAHGHDFVPATCESPKYCKTCHEIFEPALGHDPSEATCVSPSVCNRCDKFLAPTVAHVKTTRTCTEDSVCEVCGFVFEKAEGHVFSGATCEQPGVCEICGEIGEEALGHDFAPATCDKPQTCRRCNKTEGEALGHIYSESTCTSLATCQRCGKTTGKYKDHEYVYTGREGNYDCYVCAYCGKSYSTYHQPTAEDMAAYAERVVELVNIERANYGLGSLSINYSAQAAAYNRAVETVSSFSHTRPNGTSCFTALDEVGVSYYTAGENIAAGQGTPEAVVEAWMNSEGHRANILYPGFTSIGVGFYYDSSAYYKYYWSQFFIG